MGPSGSGKSTLFNMIGGLDKPSEGKVYIDEVDIAQLDSYELAWMRCRKIGYIFQTFNLIPVMTALENVMLPMVFAGMTTADAQDKAAEILKRVELGHRLFNRPSEMSGGQQQRVAIAGVCERPEHYSGGRTDGEPRFANGETDHRPAAATEQGTWGDYYQRDARPQDAHGERSDHVDQRWTA